MKRARLEKGRPYPVREGQKTRLNCLCDASRGERFEGPNGEVRRLLLKIFKEEIMDIFVSLLVENVQAVREVTKPKDIRSLFVNLGYLLGGFIPDEEHQSNDRSYI